MPELLVEIGLEEIPARMIASAEAELGRRVADVLTRERLAEAGFEFITYSTPRRLAVHVVGVKATQDDAEEQLTGPSWAVAFKGGGPTPAAHAFAKKAGVSVDALDKVTTAKGEYVSARVHRAGRAAASVLTELLSKEVGALYWAKNMYWRAGKPERFVRPVKWLLALLDENVLPLEFGGVRAGNVSYGHRVLHGAAPIPIARPAAYLPALEKAHVMADVAARRHTIRKALDRATRIVPGLRWREDEPLVDAVTHLTEWPSVVLGSFEPEYLTLPEEVLVTVMRDHQKYFAVEDAAGKLAPHFLAVLNTAVADAAQSTIRHGNERVLRARFNDARFFWNVDQKITLEDRVEMLKAVTFQRDLGSYYQKTERTLVIGQRLEVFARKLQFDSSVLERAIRLAKTDLTTDLVKEFPELQGVVGGMYARAQEEDEEVAEAIYWQYEPITITNPSPPTIEGQLLGLADRIGTVADMFEKGFVPTGSKDPYALRRAANAIIKILADSDLQIGLVDIECAATGRSHEEVRLAPTALGAFLSERLTFYLKDACHIRYDIANAVVAKSAKTSASGFFVPDSIKRAQAVTSALGSADMAAVSAALKRSKNILRQAGESNLLKQGDIIYQDLLLDHNERDLREAVERIAPQVEELRAKRDYPLALKYMATLRPYVDNFFDNVMVMVEDAEIRSNRLALITVVAREFSTIADFSEIVSTVSK